MRNLKRALSLTLASVMLLGMMVVGSSAAAGYDDVADTDNVEAIEVLQAIEVMVGDERGFGPERPVNRAEMAVVMGKLLSLDYNYYSTSCPFNDVYDWAQGWVGACAANKIVSGRGNGVYDPGATVTAVEAASMLMRALGYFQYQNDYADGFEVSTVRQGTIIGIFNGVGSSATEPMTRNQVAQMVLNALQSSVVEPDGNTTTFLNPDGSVLATTGKVNYVSVTSRQDFAYAISDVQASSVGSQNDGAIVELGERLYDGDLELDDTARDDFGRPARDWKYRGSEIGTYVKKELIRNEWTVEVTGKDLYDAITKAILDDDKYDKNVYIDGQDDARVNDRLFDLVANDLRNNKDGVGATGNGVLTQLFIDPKSGNDREQKDVTVAIINTYLARARADYSEKKDEVDFNVYGIDEVTGYRDEYKKFIDARDNTNDDYEILTVTGDDFNIADIVKDDTFLVTVAQGDIQTIAEPEVISAATMTAFKKDDNVVVNGTQYKYSDAAEWNYKVLDRYTGIDGRENLKDKSYDVYLDKYGYAIGVDLVDEVDNYIFITGVDDDLSNRFARNIKASGILLDGTMTEITYDATDSDKLVPSTGDKTPAENDWGLVNTWCTYTVNKDGIYTLKQVASAINTDAGVDVAQSWDETIAVSANENTIDKKNIDLVGGKTEPAGGFKRVYGNDDTVYLNASVKTINVDSPSDTWHGVIDDVDSVTVGIDNVSLDLYIYNAAPTGGSTLAAAGTAAAQADENGKVASGNYCEDVAHGAYALYDDEGYIIAAVTVADDGSTSDNWVYVISGNVNRESYDAEKDEWTWSREVVVDGEKTEISYTGDALKYLSAKANDGKEGMLKYNWYEVKYKGDGNVKSVKLAVDALVHQNGVAAATANDKYEGNINHLEDTVQNGKDTILYEASKYQNERPTTIGGATGYGAFTNQAGLPYLNGKSFYVTSTDTTGFRVKDSTKVVFIQTNKNDEQIDYYEGPDKLEDVAKSLNKGVGATETDGKYNYEISAVLDGNVARVVVVRDLNKDNGSSVIGGGTTQYAVSVTGSTSNMTYTISDGTNTANNNSLAVAKGANVTVTFTAAPGYVFTENGRSTLTKALTNVSKAESVAAPEVQRGAETIDLKIELGAGVSYIQIGGETYGTGMTISKVKGSVLVIGAYDNAGTAIDDDADAVAQFQSSDGTDNINITMNAADKFVMTLTENGTLYVTADDDDIAQMYFEDAKERIESRTFDLWYALTDDEHSGLMRGPGISYFDNKEGFLHGNVWSNSAAWVEITSNGEKYKFSEDVEKAALYEMLIALTSKEGDGYNLNPHANGSPIYISAASMGDGARKVYNGNEFREVVSGLTKEGDSYVFTRTVAIMSKGADGLVQTATGTEGDWDSNVADDKEIGKVTVRYKMTPITAPEDWKALAKPSVTGVTGAADVSDSTVTFTLGSGYWAQGRYRLYAVAADGTATAVAGPKTADVSNATTSALTFSGMSGLTAGTAVTYKIAYYGDVNGQRDPSDLSDAVTITPVD